MKLKKIEPEIFYLFIGVHKSMVNGHNHLNIQIQLQEEYTVTCKVLIRVSKFKKCSSRFEDRYQVSVDSQYKQRALIPVNKIHQI